MKKIFMGMFFRLFKGFELYVLIVAIMLSSAYVITRQIDEDGFVCISRTDDTFNIEYEDKEIVITRDNIEQKTARGVTCIMIDTIFRNNSQQPSNHDDILVE